MNTRLVILLTVLLFFIGLGAFYFIWFMDKGEQVWNRDWKMTLEKGKSDGRPIILAVVKVSCNDDDNQVICPSPKKRNLQDFHLVEIIHGSRDYLELGYDDRFIPDIETPPVFYLMNTDGEIRDIQNEFPIDSLLERWKKIK